MRACDNPFRVERTDNLSYRSPGFRWSDLLAHLRRNDGRGALRGAQGSGKTTLLRDLGARLAELGFEVRHLRPDVDDSQLARHQVDAFPEAAGQKTALLLDGADRVGSFGWRRLVKRARLASVLVITTHRKVRLPTLHRCATSVELLTELATELAPVTQLAEVRFAELFDSQKGNVRSALRILYDRFAAG